MMFPKSIADIEGLIREKVQENLHLDYKDSRALDRSKRDEMTKDVTAFANSDGGVLVYGVIEKDRLPVRIDDGVDDDQMSREWLENTLTSNIHPKLSDLRIFPILLQSGRHLYTVVVPKSYRGPHQASDKRFYKRHNFKSEPMEGYEINDVRERSSRIAPLITFRVSDYRHFIAAFDIENVSNQIAQDVTFEFLPELPWTNERKPPLLVNGIRKFPPKQAFRFRYEPFHVILGENTVIPGECEVRIEYYHPELGQRVTDEWPVNFEAFRQSMSIRSETEDLVKESLAELANIRKELQKLNSTFEGCRGLVGATGLNLSSSTISRLVKGLRGGEPIARIPTDCIDYAAIREILGVDFNTAHKIEEAFHARSMDQLSKLPGMTSHLMARIAETFDLDWPQEEV